MNQHFWGKGLIEFYLDFIKHLDKPIKEVADCSHQHSIYHTVGGAENRIDTNVVDMLVYLQSCTLKWKLIGVSRGKSDRC